MRRIVIPPLLLTGICLAGSWNLTFLRGHVRSLSALMEQAEAAAGAEDWPRAEALTQQAQQLWQAKRSYICIVLHQDQIEEADASFHSVLAFIRWQELPEYTSSNALLLAQLEHLWAAELFTAENLF